MSVSHRYRNFGEANRPEPEAAKDTAAALEAEKLASFEQGYQAGWEDATKAQADEKSRISAEFGQKQTFQFRPVRNWLPANYDAFHKQVLPRSWFVPTFPPTIETTRPTMAGPVLT